MEVIERPTSTTVIAWLFVILGVLGMLVIPVSYYTLNNPQIRQQMQQQIQQQVDQDPALRGKEITVPAFGIVQVVISALYMIANIVAGIFLLKGAKWARWLCVELLAYNVASTMYEAANMAYAVPWAIAAIVVGMLLFKSSANEFFNADSTL